MGPGEETVVLSLGSGRLYTCNETTESFLRALDGQRTLAEVTGLLARQYDVPLGQLLADLEDLARKLLAEGLIVPAPSGSRRR